MWLTSELKLNQEARKQPEVRLWLQNQRMEKQGKDTLKWELGNVWGQGKG